MTNELLSKAMKNNELHAEWKTTVRNAVNYKVIKLRFKNLRNRNSVRYQKYKKKLQ